MSSVRDAARRTAGSMAYKARKYVSGADCMGTRAYSYEKIDEFMVEMAKTIQSKLSIAQRRFHTKMEWQSKMHEDNRETIRVKLVTSATSAYEIHLPYSHFCYGSMFDLEKLMGDVLGDLIPWLLISAAEEKKRAPGPSITVSDTPWL